MGRQHKMNRSLEQIQAYVKQKLHMHQDKDGNITYRKNEDAKLTLEETAVALALIEKKSRPFTKTYIMKYEQRILEKLREGLKAYNCYN